ncbi:MAG: MGMT family protein [Saprospiraceae bacterium]|nr:MGMT family protein [Saprospiraceae bacterium]
MTPDKSDSYFDLVYEVTRSIPAGRVSTYGAIADFLSLGSARMVGWALNQCHGMKDLPAHRVVNRKGELSGRVHFKPPSSMAARLRKEGVKVKNDQVTEFESLFWHPKEMELD